MDAVESKRISRLLDFVKENIFIIFVFFLIIVACLFVPYFLTTTNLLNILTQIAINGLLATGMTYVIITGGIDLSVGSVAALSGVIVTAILTHMQDANLFICLLLTLVVSVVVGSICGGFIGIAVSKLNVAPFIATFAMYSIARGLSYIYTQSKPIYALPDAFTFLGAGYLGALPVLGILMVVVIGIAWFVEKNTTYGRHIFAVGSNEEVSKLSGVKVAGVKCRVYIICSVLAALGGICLASRLDSGQPSAANGYELTAIAAVAMGGTSMSGGSGSITKTLTGIITIGVINNCLSLLKVDSYWQPVAMGIIIFVAVAFDQLKATNRLGR